MDCIVCDGKTKISIEKREIEFKKNKYLVNYSFYQCLECKEKFTDTNLDEKNISQVYNQYREQFKILFPDEIIEIREEYGFSKRKMSQILGWGDNTYGLYEKGAVPNESHSTVLEIIKDPKNFLDIVKKKVDVIISDREYEEVKNKIDLMIKKNARHEICFSFDDLIVNQFSGYIKPNFEKLAQMVIFFIFNSNTFLTRLNKLLFYSDFLSYKYYKRPISGWNYAAIDKGPVVDHYRYIFGLLEEKEFIKSKEAFLNQNNNVIEEFVQNKEYAKSLFDNNEIHILKFVDSHFKSIKTKELIDMSHKERGWIENFPSKALISYQKYADEISIALE